MAEKVGMIRWFLKELPFNRFYLNEKLAPEAEQELQRHTRKGSALARVQVYHDGNFALDELIVDGKPLLERLRGRQ